MKKAKFIISEDSTKYVSSKWDSSLSEHDNMVNKAADLRQLIIDYFPINWSEMIGCPYSCMVYSEEYIKKIQEENKLLRETLEFYADEYNWLSRSPTLADVICDKDIEQLEMTRNLSCNTGGKRAREVLKKIDKKDEE